MCSLLLLQTRYKKEDYIGRAITPLFLLRYWNNNNNNTLYARSFFGEKKKKKNTPPPPRASPTISPRVRSAPSVRTCGQPNKIGAHHVLTFAYLAPCQLAFLRSCVAHFVLGLFCSFLTPTEPTWPLEWQAPSRRLSNGVRSPAWDALYRRSHLPAPSTSRHHQPQRAMECRPRPPKVPSEPSDACRNF